MLSEELEVSLNSLYQNAHKRRHEYITVEHVLVGLLDNPSAAPVLRAFGSDIEELRRNLSAFIEDNVPKLDVGSKVDTQPTLGFQRVIQRAVLYVQGAGKKEVTGTDVLSAIFGEKESYAAKSLLAQNINHFDVVNLLTHGIATISRPNQRETPVVKEGNKGKKCFLGRTLGVKPGVVL